MCTGHQLPFGNGTNISHKNNNTYLPAIAAGSEGVGFGSDINCGSGSGDGGTSPTDCGSCVFFLTINLSLNLTS